MSSDSVKRLHITPFNPALLDAVLNPSVRSLARDVSFHTIETFPENDYGFVTLPTMEADKVVKKLNGSILKGNTFKIQEAATPKRRLVADDAHAENATGEKCHTERSSKKRKESGETLPGFELPSQRRVKRGWTETPAKDRRARKKESSEAENDEKERKSRRSKYTDHRECLFRAAPPANKANISEGAAKHEKKKKRKRIPEEVVVHEFKNTAPQPTFVKSGNATSQMDMTSEFVEGIGWVDRAGNVKEPSSIKTKERPIKPPVSSIKQDKPKPKDNAIAVNTPSFSPEADSDETSSSGSSIEGSSSEEAESDSVDEGEPALRTSPQHSNSSERSLSSSSPESSDADEEAGIEEATKKLRPESTEDNEQDNSSTPVPNSSKETSNTTEVHPLEELFKRPVSSSASTPKPPLEVNTQFSFFGDNNDDIDEEEDEENRDAQYLNEPHTPFTKTDMQDRSLRSAAPTPDTAAFNRTKFWDRDSNENDDDEDNDKDGDNSPRPAAATSGKQLAKVEESDFSKWFWENRGDNNRAWKRRRREAAKEKRQRENRKRGRAR